MRPNNVFMSDARCYATVKCTTMLEEWPERSNHLPIVTIIDIELEVQVEAHRPNYRATDWDEFREALAGRLLGLETGELLNSKGEFHR